MIEHLVGENILLSVDPEVWESFLSRVEDFSEVTEAALLV
jgi:hypothetical protein